MGKQAAPKILYFINGPIATDEEIADAAKYPGAVFRNAARIVPGDPIEAADEYAGAVPEEYTTGRVDEPMRTKRQRRAAKAAIEAAEVVEDLASRRAAKHASMGIVPADGAKGSAWGGAPTTPAASPAKTPKAWKPNA